MNESLRTVVSGIRATGQLHLGNFLGAIVQFLALVKLHRCFSFSSLMFTH